MADGTTDISSPRTELEIEDDDGIGLLDLAIPLFEHLKLLIVGPLLAGLAAIGITFLMNPTFTARTSFLPPQQPQNSAASALASLGALSGLAANAANIKSPADQYVALMQSTTVADRIIDQFKLMELYDKQYRVDARKVLAANVRIAAGKKDGLITVDVDDESPQRAADIANRYVVELRNVTDRLSLTEAQQRRSFFEVQLKQTRDRLTDAQQALQASGFNQGAIRAEPRAAAEGYARLRAEMTAAEVRLQTLRSTLTDNNSEVQQQQNTLAALRSQLGKLEAANNQTGGPDYVTKYREFKYQETLFDLFARQYELARADESRESSLVQVVDPALPPERKSAPKRALVAIVTAAVSFMLLAAFVVVRHFWRQSANDPVTAEKMARLRLARGVR